MIKKILLLIAISLITQHSWTQQNTAVEKSVYGFQAGVLGFWAHNESRLDRNISIRTELGFDAGIFSSNADFSGSKVGVIFIPSITLEPRLYYNLHKRMDKGKNISENSGNFVALKLNYRPDWFTLSNVKNTSVADNIAIIPKWGIRRTFWNHLTYELGAGVGYRKYFLKQYGYAENPGEVGIDLHIRLGYTF
ncbi:hypothetical protein LB465_15725 [Salegentibacter sp. LM13S]|uniref:hypothetical protein n=1 Tax=Salegentibacter lacus TaxID=2873599 RepID=UPI001CCDD03D|nr:hypothetical protein [Salegentibacter lacus]MBZ9632231.1 hypothetical protein [Salegentibacter lacus]